MDFDLNEQQSEILNGLEQLLSSTPVDPPHEGLFVAWGETLDATLSEAGYLDVVGHGLNLIDGALIVERVARVPVTVEAATSTLIAPLFGEEVKRPFALASGSLDAPARFLPFARTVLLDIGDCCHAIEVGDADIESLDTLFAYPYGRLRSTDGLTVRTFDNIPVESFRRRRRIAMTVEAAGLMRGALDIALDHVKTRTAFGRPIGGFQAVQHRLVLAAEVAEGVRWLSFAAAASDDDADALIAATYLQDSIPRFCNDLHQFTGAMGLTLEFPLHYFTYRLRALLGEMGGGSAQAQALVNLTWAA